MSLGWMTLVSQRLFSTPSSNMAPPAVVVSWKICWRWTSESATCSLRSSSTSRQTGHYWRTQEQVAVFERRRIQSLQNKRVQRKAVNCRRTAASPATSAAVSVHQGSDLSPTNEFISDPEIRRVDGSVQQRSITCCWAGWHSFLAEVYKLGCHKFSQKANVSFCTCLETWSRRGQFTCPKGHLSEMYRRRVRVRVSVTFRNLHNSISDDPSDKWPVPKPSHKSSALPR